MKKYRVTHLPTGSMAWFIQEKSLFGQWKFRVGYWKTETDALEFLHSYHGKKITGIKYNWDWVASFGEVVGN